MVVGDFQYDDRLHCQPVQSSRVLLDPLSGFEDQAVGAIKVDGQATFAISRQQVAAAREDPHVFQRLSGAELREPKLDPFGADLPESTLHLDVRGAGVRQASVLEQDLHSGSHLLRERVYQISKGKYRDTLCLSTPAKSIKGKQRRMGQCNGD